MQGNLSHRPQDILQKTKKKKKPVTTRLKWQRFYSDQDREPGDFSVRLQQMNPGMTARLERAPS